MKWLLILFPFLVSGQCLEADIVLVVDASASVSMKKEITALAVETFVSKFDYSEYGIKLGVISFSTTNIVLSELTSNKVQLLQTPQRYLAHYLSSTTNLTSALKRAEKMLDEGRNVSKIIVLFTDGEPDSKTLSSTQAQLLQSKNVLICGVLINVSKIDELFLSNLCSGCYVATDYGQLIKTVEEFDICQ